MNNEPVAELALEQMAVGDASSLRVKWLTDSYPPVGAKLYTHPADLTDEEIRDLAGYAGENPSMDDMIEFARAILRKAQEK